MMKRIVFLMLLLSACRSERMWFETTKVLSKRYNWVNGVRENLIAVKVCGKYVEFDLGEGAFNATEVGSTIKVQCYAVAGFNTVPTASMVEDYMTEKPQ